MLCYWVNGIGDRLLGERFCYVMLLGERYHDVSTANNF